MTASISTTASKTPSLLSLGTNPLGDAVPEIRLHAPAHDVVIVRVYGHLDSVGARLLAERVGYHLGRARHVIIELVGKHLLDPAAAAAAAVGVTALRELAHHCGSLLHVAADHEGVRRQLADAGLPRPLRTCADEVLAALSTRPLTPPQPSDGSASEVRLAL